MVLKIVCFIKTLQKGDKKMKYNTKRIIKKLVKGKMLDVSNIYKDKAEKYYLDITDIAKDVQKGLTRHYTYADFKVNIIFDLDSANESRVSFRNLSPEVKAKLAVLPGFNLQHHME